MKSVNYLPEVREQYEDFPYPLRCPEDEKTRLTYTPDFLELRSAGVIESGVEHPLSALPEDGIAWYLQDSPGPPIGYALQGRQIRLAPQPAGTTWLRLAYYASVPPLSGEDADTSVLLAYPSAYLYGTLRHLALYAIDPEAAARWGAAFLSTVLGANRAAMDRGPGSYGR